MSVMIASGRQMRLVMNGTATAVARAEASAVRMATANLAAAAICQERSEVAARLAEQAGWMSAGTALVASGALLSGWLARSWARW
ncbi:MAG: hypothetical protein HY329_03905 [Chloroflexi bacterium]|nr:hypothetical protein [Chloroflexota bacterium]